MFRAIKIINSINKKNIHYIAVGSYQVEFFEKDNNDYFTIYRFDYAGEGHARYNLINLNDSKITKISNVEFQINQGASKYNLGLIENDSKASFYVIRYLWGWLPLSKFGGNVSNTGISSIKSKLEKYINH